MAGHGNCFFTAVISRFSLFLLTGFLSVLMQAVKPCGRLYESVFLFLALYVAVLSYYELFTKFKYCLAVFSGNLLQSGLIQHPTWAVKILWRACMPSDLIYPFQKISAFIVLFVFVAGFLGITELGFVFYIHHFRQLLNLIKN